MKTRLWLIALLVTAVLLAGIPAVSAFTVTQVSPAGTNLYRNGAIELQVNGLNAGDVFTYQITSTTMAPTGNTVSINNVNMPFSFNAGSATTTLTTTGLTGNPTLTVTRLSDSTQVQYTANPITSNNNIQADNYNVAITGNKAGTTVGIDYKVTGTVSAGSPATSTLSLTMADVTGTVTIEVFQGATSVFQQTFTVTAPPTPAPTPQSGSGDDTGGPSGPAGPAAGPVAPAQLAPPGVSPTSVTFQQNEQGQVLGNYMLETDPAAGFASQLDIEAGTQIVSATGAPVNEISVTPLDPATTPEQAGGNVYSFSGLSVECEPSGTQFVGGSVTISFEMTDQQWADALAAVNGNTAAMTIEFYDAATQTWVEVATTVDPVTHTVSAQVTHFSTYALFYKPVTATAPQTFGEIVQQTAVSTPVVTATGTQAPAPMLAPTETPTQQGGILDGLFKWISDLFGGK